MKEIHKKTKGILGENEDWWYLCTEEDGTKTVIHEWSYIQLKGLKTNDGQETYTVENFLTRKDVWHHNREAIDKLNTMLNPLGL